MEIESRVIELESKGGQNPTLLKEGKYFYIFCPEVKLVSKIGDLIMRNCLQMQL